MLTHEIRIATDGDAPGIADLLRQLGYPVTANEVPQRMRHVRDNNRATVLVAVRDNALIGLATAHVLSVINRANDVAWLTALVVHEHFRRRGVGRSLVAAVESFAHASGCERLSVTTHLDRAEAQAFYLGVGFTLTGKRYGKAPATPDVMHKGASV